MSKTIKDLFDIDSNAEVLSLEIDSRKVKKGSVFFCMPGISVDGHKFASVAAKSNAVCIVHSKPLEEYFDDVVYVKVDDVVKSMNDTAAKFNDCACDELKIYAVTGTNGKTSIGCIMKDVLDNFTKAGYIGTIANKYNIVHDNSPHTTPDAIVLHSIFKAMREDSIEALAMEVSSHGLEQRRVDSVKFDVAIFTNITHEHLDFHKTMDNYLSAKAKLFVNLGEDKTAVLNNDDELSIDFLKKSTKAKIYTYGVKNQSDYMAKNIVLNPDYTEFDLEYNSNIYIVKTNLVAMFNVYNLLAAIAALHEGGKGYDLEKIISCVEHITQIQGRIETIQEGQDFHMVVDYAHTPDGFEKIYEYANEIKNGNRIISVFGSAGQRDFEKRPVLGQISDKYCDVIILTQEDCRKEDPQQIANDIKKGISKAECFYEEDRYKAIEMAAKMAKSGDVVLILAKANEKFLDCNGHNLPWMGDVDASKEIIKKIL